MLPTDRLPRRRPASWLPVAVALLGIFRTGPAAAEGPADPLSRIRVQPIAAGSPGAAPQALAVETGDPLGLLPRLKAALAAAKSPDQPVPHPAASAAAAAAPLSARVGRDVTLVARPGVGTPAQIRGERLHARVESAEAAADPDLATARAFLRANRALLGVSDPDTELAPETRLTDEIGLRHLRFEQRYRGLPVWPADLIVHLDRQGNVYLLDGAFVPTPRVATMVPVLDAGAASRRARAETPAGAAAQLATPELIVYAPGMRAARLAWRVDASGAPDQTATLVIDAANGTLLASIPRVMTENVAGSGRDLFGQTVPLNVWREGLTYSMIDTSKPMFRSGCAALDFTKNCGAIYLADAGNTPPSSSPDVRQATIADVTSSNPNSWSPADAVSAASAFGKVYDYYRQRHNRDSIDGKGGNILAIVRLGLGYQNAYWTDSIGGMFFGDAEPYAGSIDVVGHEMTHGVTSNTAGLIYQDQAGALNEAMSDVFGEMVENYATGSNDWLLGSRLSRPLRSMSDPAQFGDPATMSQYINTTQDHGGVHHNSGIINHAYYLLAQGETGAIGLSDAEKIFYRALTTHLTKNSQFLDARLACVQSADEIFGAGSNQSRRTAQAFDAVEILVATPAPPPPTVPSVNAADSTVFLYRNGPLLLGRRETAFGDPAQGVGIAATPAANERPAVSGDGSLAFFVTATNDACFVPTSASQAPSCLGLPGEIASVAMSRDANVYAFVLLSAGQRENLIRVIDLAKNTTSTYTLVAPATDAGTAGTVLFADTLEFTANRRFLFYDAFNVLKLAGGTQVGLWSISAIDFSGSQTYTVIPPTPGLDVGNPSVAKTNDDYLTFEADDLSDGKAAIFAANVSTGNLTAVVTGIGSGPAVPSYAGDDRALVYSYPDASTATGRSLARIALAADRVTAIGQPAPWLSDGAQGVVYRRGAYSAPGGNCTPSATALCLSGGRFQVTATFTTVQGQQGTGQAVRLTSDTGYFTFFDPSNVEIVVKVLNACSFSGRVWVFAGGLTNVATVITVTDTATGVSRTYANPQNTAFQPIQDTSAFSTCFTGSLAPARESALAADAWSEVRRALAARPSTPTLTSDAASGGEATTPSSAGRAAATPLAPSGPCVPDAQSLCLSNGRFRVQTSFRTPAGQTGNGSAERLTADTGYFWFFQPSNVEMVVKVLNACSFSNRIWVFAGGLTNVEVTTTVTDTQTGLVQTYRNPLNQPFQPLQDTSAFATCP